MFGPVSGGHFNPVVSLVDASFGGLRWRDALAYIPAQIAGCIPGAIAANAMFAQTAITHLNQAPRLARAPPRRDDRDLGLMLVIFSLARTKRGTAAPAAVGAYIGAAYFFTSSTSFANPAIASAACSPTPSPASHPLRPRLRRRRTRRRRRSDPHHPHALPRRHTRQAADVVLPHEQRPEPTGAAATRMPRLDEPERRAHRSPPNHPPVTNERVPASLPTMSVGVHVHDRELLRRTREGDAEAFGCSTRSRRGDVLGYLRVRVPSAELAADLMCETFAKALLVVHDADRELPVVPIAWLLAIARHELIDSVRRGRVADETRRRLAMEPLELSDPDLAAMEDATAEAELLGQLRESLPEDQFQALTARVIDGREYAEIAASCRRPQVLSASGSAERWRCCDRAERKHDEFCT